VTHRESRLDKGQCFEGGIADFATSRVGWHQERACWPLPETKVMVLTTVRNWNWNRVQEVR
jgi:hypothetical protein